MLSRLSQTLAPLSGKSPGTLVLSPQTDVAALTTLKDCFGELSVTSTSRAQKAVAVAVYCAAIASALVFHDQKITTLSYAQLDESLTELQTRSWVSPALKELFGKASAICRRKG